MKQDLKVLSHLKVTPLLGQPQLTHLVMTTHNVFIYTPCLLDQLEQLRGLSIEQRTYSVMVLPVTTITLIQYLTTIKRLISILKVMLNLGVLHLMMQTQ